MIKKFDDKVQLCTRPEFGEDIYGLLGKKSNEELTKAMLETLSIIAYKQPVTRQEVEELRGVNSSYIINSLLAKKLIKEAGRKQVLGRPILYRTDEEFLRHFGIENLEELQICQKRNKKGKNVKPKSKDSLEAGFFVLGNISNSAIYNIFRHNKGRNFNCRAKKNILCC